MNEPADQPDDVLELFWHAQQLEEYADSMGADPQLYAVADEAWQKAFDAAERAGGAQQMERYAAVFGWSTPAQREAQQNDHHTRDDPGDWFDR
jgi:hypothetical protein